MVLKLSGNATYWKQKTMLNAVVTKSEQNNGHMQIDVNFICEVHNPILSLVSASFNRKIKNKFKLWSC